MKVTTESNYGVFRRFSHRTSIAVGSPGAFMGALVVVIDPSDDELRGLQLQFVALRKSAETARSGGLPSATS